MKKLFIIIFAVLILTNCKKDDIKEDITYYDLALTDNWETIDFKTNYTIQVPDNFVGAGLVGFEGFTFSKHSEDNKIKLSAGYCNALFCFDFGDNLEMPIPSTIQITNNYSKKVTLDQVEYFQRNSETTGVFYYSKGEISFGKLYWNDNGTLKRALDVEFDLSYLDIVNKIIATIRIK